MNCFSFLTLFSSDLVSKISSVSHIQSVVIVVLVLGSAITTALVVKLLVEVIHNTKIIVILRNTDHYTPQTWLIRDVQYINERKCTDE